MEDDLDVELRNELIPQIAAALREAVPEATYAHIHVNDADTDTPYLYAGVILNAQGKRIGMEDPSAPENQVINALVDSKTKASWDGYTLELDVVRGVEMETDFWSLISD